MIRLLPQNTALIGIEQLGLSKTIAENYKRLLRNPAGLVLGRERFDEADRAYAAWQEHVRQACVRHRLAPAATRSR